MRKDEFTEYLRYNPRNTELFQYIVSFCVGVMFGAISLGFVWMLIFLVIYEVYYVFATGGEYPYWVGYSRVSNFLLSIIGWILGRYIMLRLDPVGEIIGKDYPNNEFIISGNFLD